MNEQFEILYLTSGLLPLAVAVPLLRTAIGTVRQKIASRSALAMSVLLIPGVFFFPSLGETFFSAGLDTASEQIGASGMSVLEMLSVLGLATAQGKLIGIQGNFLNSAQGRPRTKRPMISVVGRRRVGRPMLTDPEGEVELASRHDAILRAWIAADMAGGERMVQLIETASEWADHPVTPEYRRAIEMLEEYWAEDLGNRINEVAASPKTAPRVRTYGNDPGIGTFGAGWYDTGDDERRYAARCRRMLEDGEWRDDSDTD